MKTPTGTFTIYNPDGSRKPEIKMAMIIDDYKLKNKEDWWANSLKHLPELTKHYVMDREEVHPGITRKTLTITRYYRLKTEGT